MSRADFSKGVRGKHAAAYAAPKPVCRECLRVMLPHEVGNETPEERVCDTCAGLAMSREERRRELTRLRQQSWYVEKTLTRWARLRGLPEVIEWISIGRWSDRAPKRGGALAPAWISVHPGGNEGVIIELHQRCARVREMRIKVFASLDEAWTVARGFAELLERAR